MGNISKNEGKGKGMFWFNIIALAGLNLAYVKNQQLQITQEQPPELNGPGHPRATFAYSTQWLCVCRYVQVLFQNHKPYDLTLPYNRAPEL